MAEASDILLEIAEKTRQRIEKQKEIRLLRKSDHRLKRSEQKNCQGKLKLRQTVLSSKL